MNQTTNNPYHCEVIGSFLRPDYLKEAMNKFQAGEITQAELTHIQDQAVLEALKLQEDVGVEVVADGEMRRRGWTAPLTVSVSGYGPAPRPSDYRVNWQAGVQQEERQGGNVTAVIKKVGRGEINLPLVEMLFLQKHTTKPIKVTLPSLAHASVFWAPGTSDKIYPDKDEYMNDVLDVMTEVVRECVDAGATYVQLDSPRYTHLVSEEGRDNFRRLGIDPQAWLGEVIEFENKLVDRFPNVTWGLHLCRGNGPRGAFSVSGGYDPIAEQLFNTIHVDRLLLEYDSPRAGNFEPLRFLPKDKVAVLGLISTKDNEIETPELLKSRIEEATKFASLDQLALSPQCGFASAFEGNMGEDLQRAKMEVLGETCREVWR